MTTGEKIAAERKKLNLTQQQFADELGVSRQAVSRWEGDAAFPETNTLLKMCKMFAVSTDYLLNYENDGDGCKSAESSFNLCRKNIFGMYFEFKSKTKIGNVPLVHINIGVNRVAKGIIAVGFVSVGVVSAGLVSLGVFAFGLLALGLLSFGSLSLGAVAFGAVAAGIIALGGLAVGCFSLGGAAAGLFAAGGYANGFYIAVGDVAAGGITFGKSASDGGIIAVLPQNYESLKQAAYEKMNQIPAVWSLFVGWCKLLADAIL